VVILTRGPVAGGTVGDGAGGEVATDRGRATGV